MLFCTLRIGWNLLYDYDIMRNTVESRKMCKKCRNVSEICEKLI